MDPLYIFVLILTHIVAFILAAIFFHYENKKEYRESWQEIERLKKEIEKKDDKINNLLDVIVAFKNRDTKI